MAIKTYLSQWHEIIHCFVFLLINIEVDNTNVNLYIPITSFKQATQTKMVLRYKITCF